MQFEPFFAPTFKIFFINDQTHFKRIWRRPSPTNVFQRSHAMMQAFEEHSCRTLCERCLKCYANVSMERSNKMFAKHSLNIKNKKLLGNKTRMFAKCSVLRGYLEIK